MAAHAFLVDQEATAAAAAAIPCVPHDERVASWATKLHREVFATAASGGFTVLAAAPFLAHNVYSSPHFTPEGRLALPDAVPCCEDGKGAAKLESVLSWRTNDKGTAVGRDVLRNLLLLGAASSIPGKGVQPIIGPDQLDVKFNPTIMKNNAARGKFSDAIEQCKLAAGKSERIRSHMDV